MPWSDRIATEIDEMTINCCKVVRKISEYQQLIDKVLLILTKQRKP